LRWQQFLIVGCLLVLFVPGWAQEDFPLEAQSTIPVEKVLNNITLESKYLDVLTRRGVPHYIGPSVAGISTISGLLQPREQTPTTSGVIGPAGMAAFPPRTAYAPNSPYAMGPTAMAQPLQESTYMIWRYDGNGKTPDPNAAFTTYVFLNEEGKVKAVVVNLNPRQETSLAPLRTPGKALTVAKPNSPKAVAVVDIRTESGISFGTKLSDIVKQYNWPEPFTRVGNLYYCNYPAQNVTFALDATTRKVTCIGIGASFTVTAQTLVPGQAATVSTGAGRTMVPSVPGGYANGMQGMSPMIPGMMSPGGMYPPGGGMYPSDDGGDGMYMPPRGDGGMYQPGGGGMYQPGM